MKTESRGLPRKALGSLVSKLHSETSGGTLYTKKQAHVVQCERFPTYYCGSPPKAPWGLN